MTFDVLSDRSRDNIGQFMRRFWDGGGRRLNVSPLCGMSEVNVGEFAKALGITDKLFTIDKVWATGEYLRDRAQAQQQLDRSL